MALANFSEDLIRFESLIADIADDPNQLGRFFNTLSLLEYMGARKILKSQRAEIFTMDLLSHVSEELRHAQMLKGMARRVLPSIQGYAASELLLGTEMRTYFQNLDRAVEQKLEGRDIFLKYLCTTRMIEERVVAIYPIIARVHPPSAEVLNAILQDEEKHLYEVDQEIRGLDLQVHSDLKELLAYEQIQFQSLCVAWPTRQNHETHSHRA